MGDSLQTYLLHQYTNCYPGTRKYQTEVICIHFCLNCVEYVKEFTIRMKGTHPLVAGGPALWAVECSTYPRCCWRNLWKSSMQSVWLTAPTYCSMHPDLYRHQMLCINKSETLNIYFETVGDSLEHHVGVRSHPMCAS